jgi:hypothetical protein
MMTLEEFLDELADYGVVIPSDEAQSLFLSLQVSILHQYCVSLLPGQAAVRIGDRICMLDASLIPVTAVKP